MFSLWFACDLHICHTHFSDDGFQSGRLLPEAMSADGAQSREGRNPSSDLPEALSAQNAATVMAFHERLDSLTAEALAFFDEYPAQLHTSATVEFLDKLDALRTRLRPEPVSVVNCLELGCDSMQRLQVALAHGTTEHTRDGKRRVARAAQDLCRAIIPLLRPIGLLGPLRACSVEAHVPSGDPFSSFLAFHRSSVWSSTLSS
eukprot:m.109599 g.109599  ORF g.109599 m.109599 type:complete len:203 (+) comp9306_c0_seq1:391-999(+)